MKKDEVKHLATLARLDLTEKEIEQYTREISDILGYIEKIKELDIKVNVSGKIEGISIRNVLREDDNVAESGVFTDDILAVAPETKDRYVKVKKIL